MTTNAPTKISFFEFLTPLINSGKKTITIRDKTESNYEVDSQVEVVTLETNQRICDIKIESVKPIKFDEINEFHAQQEAMSLATLQKLIKEIYPNTDGFFVITFKLIINT